MSAPGASTRRTGAPRTTWPRTLTAGRSAIRPSARSGAFAATTSTGRALVVGGAVLDILAHADAGPTQRTSNPGRITTTPGGVAHNIAVNLARLGTSARLVAALGDDASGREVRAGLRAAGVDTSLLVATGHPTGRYVAVLDAGGELAVAVADLRATEALGGADLTGPIATLGPRDVLVLEANLSTQAIIEALDATAATGARTVVDPVGVTKAERVGAALAAKPARMPWLVTPNLDELASLVGAPVERSGAEAAASRLLDLGIEHVWVRLGPNGSLLVSARGGASPQATHLLAPPTTLRDVTGAGDSATAGFVHAWLAGADPAAAAAYGHQCAAATVASDQTVRPDLLVVVGPPPPIGADQS